MESSKGVAMMRFHSDRSAFAYVVGIDGREITLNLKDQHKGFVASHREGITTVTDIGSLFGVDGGSKLIVLKVTSISFAEPREAHRPKSRKDGVVEEPLRNLVSVVVGVIYRTARKIEFNTDSLTSPALGAEAYPLVDDELDAILGVNRVTNGIDLGVPTRGGAHLRVDVSGLLSRHVAVLGSTGQGKSCFTAATLQQLAKGPKSRIVVFDINGEYEGIFKSHIAENLVKVTRLGGASPTRKIPYIALGRHGLGRLLLPSEKTQRPALNFALDNLNKVKWFDANGGAGLADSKVATLFDDCRQAGADDAHKTITALRTRSAKTLSSSWPPLSALSCLIAESHSLKPNNRGMIERAAFEYGNVSNLITKIKQLLSDEIFLSVVDAEALKPAIKGKLSWQSEGEHLINELFGLSGSEKWRVHIINIREVAHDLMPLVLGSLLELLAFELFRRGPGKSTPTLLVLEEAHHYLRQITQGDDGSGNHALAYERLSKEGRKFGLSLWISTQRPSEVSPTVLSQCGTWVCFRLNGEQDLKAVSSATEWADRQELSRISGLPRRQAIIFGSGVTMPVRVESLIADPLPESTDPNFSVWFEGMNEPTT